MRNYLLAAIVALLATWTGDALAQSSNDDRLRWMGVRNDSKSDVSHIHIIPSSKNLELLRQLRLMDRSSSGSLRSLLERLERSSAKDCCWSRNLLEPEQLRSGEVLLVDFDVGRKECQFDVLVSGRDRDWYFRGIDVCDRHELSELSLKESSGDSKNRKVMLRNESAPTAGNELVLAAGKEAELTARSVYAIPSDSYCCWSRNLLGENTIAPGGSFPVNFDDGNRTCLFDILVEGRRNRGWYFERMNVCREAGQPELTLALKEASDDRNDRKMKLENNSRHAAFFVQAIPSGRDCCWSHDLLGIKIVRPGVSHPVNFDDGSGECLFDILVRGGRSSDQSWDWYFERMNICRGPGQTELILALKDSSGDGKVREMTMNNESRLTALIAYAIPSGRDCCWSYDLLGTDTIPSGRSFSVSFDDGRGTCVFDIRITSNSPGLEWNFDGVDVCSPRDGKRRITLK